MNIYFHLIENPLFFKWIYYPNAEINAYWEQFLEQNPSDASLILEFKSKFEKHLRYKSDQLSNDEKKELARKILHRIEVEDNRRNRLKIVKTVMRYAAVAILFLAIGSAFSYFFMEQKISNDFVQNLPIPPLNIQEPTLIIENEQEISLSQGESEIQYSDKGDITVDDNFVIEGDKEESAPKMNTLIIPYGNRSTITLSDGTNVILNAGSRLIYPSKFVDKKREVFLVGEAFFQVEKNKERPFVVKTPDAEIEVLGTKFNLSAYPDENIVQTVLTEGSIKLSLAHPGIFERSVLLHPGQLANTDKNERTTSIYDVDVDYYTSWKDGFFSFYYTDLSRVAKKLERYFNIRIFYEDPLDGTIKISGKLDVTKNKEEIFEYMTKLTGLNFDKINERSYRIR